MTMDRVKLVIAAQLIYNKLERWGFKRGAQTDLCIIYGGKYNISIKSLMSYVSYLKCYNNINRRTFTAGLQYKKCMIIINENRDKNLIKLLDEIKTLDKATDYLKYLEEKFDEE